MSTDASAEIELWRWGGVRPDRLRTYTVVIDGDVAGKIREDEVLRFEVTPGAHRVQLRLDWFFRSREVEVSVRPGRRIRLGCSPAARAASPALAVALAAPRHYIALGIDYSETRYVTVDQVGSWLIAISNSVLPNGIWRRNEWFAALRSSASDEELASAVAEALCHSGPVELSEVTQRGASMEPVLDAIGLNGLDQYYVPAMKEARIIDDGRGIEVIPMEWREGLTLHELPHGRAVLPHQAGHGEFASAIRRVLAHRP